MKKISAIIGGNMIIAFAITLLLNNNIVAGGVSGIGVVVNHFWGLSISACVTLLNIVLFVLGLIFEGKLFATKTLISTFSFPAFLELFQRMTILEDLDSPLTAAIAGGMLVGIGLGIVIRAGASTGGVDIIGILVNKKFNIPINRTLNILDMIIIALQMPTRSLHGLALGILSILITYTVMKFVLNGSIPVFHRKKSAA